MIKAEKMGMEYGREIGGPCDLEDQMEIMVSVCCQIKCWW